MKVYVRVTTRDTILLDMSFEFRIVLLRIIISIFCKHHSSLHQLEKQTDTDFAKCQNDDSKQYC